MTEWARRDEPPLSPSSDSSSLCLQVKGLAESNQNSAAGQGQCVRNFADTSTVAGNTSCFKVVEPVARVLGNTSCLSRSTGTLLPPPAFLFVGAASSSRKTSAIHATHYVIARPVPSPRAPVPDLDTGPEFVMASQTSVPCTWRPELRQLRRTVPDWALTEDTTPWHWADADLSSVAWTPILDRPSAFEQTVYRQALRADCRLTMRALLAGVCLAAAACATFDVIDSVEGFGSVSLYSPAISATVGPQKPLTNPFEGVIRVVVTDPCDPSDRGDLKDKIVVLGLDPPSTCSYEKMYLHFQAAGAKAVLFSKSRVTPGYNLYRRDAQLAAVTSRMDMMFLQISPSRKLHAALKTGMRARVSPDPNVWKPVFGSWYYQTFLRFLPGCVLIAAGLAAATFLTMHIRLISDSFLAQYSVERRTMRRRVTYIWERISGLQLMILLTEAVSATILGLALVIGGWCSTSNLPAPVVLYFMTAMSGEGFACSKMAAIVWNRKLHETFPVEKPSVMTRLFRGDWWWGSAALCLVPLSISTALSILMSQYHRTTAFQALVTATFLALQILVGSHIIYEVCRYHREVSRVAKSVQGTVNTTAVNTFLRRISRCVLMLSMSMAMQVVASLIIICFLQFFFSPPGWTIAYGLFLNGRAVDSASRVAMFRPIRRNNAPADGSRFTSPAKSSATSSIMRSKRTAGALRTMRNFPR